MNPERTHCYICSSLPDPVSPPPAITNYRSLLIGDIDVHVACVSALEQSRFTNEQRQESMALAVENTSQQ